MSDFLIAVDGGNVKTDLALVGSTGELLALVRGGRSSPHYEGVDGCVGLIGSLLAQAAASARVALPAADAELMIAGVDLPEELDALERAVRAQAWAGSMQVANDTQALLRSGTDRGWGVAVVCGGGINCVGRTPDGRELRFPALGAISGDWGGGVDIGLAALRAAARSADGRGPATVLESEVPAYFGLARPFEVARALHLRELAFERLAELTRVVFPAAASDAVAAAIVERQADEVVAMASVALTRLELTGTDADVVLGGGVLRAAPPGVVERIAAAVRAHAPAAVVRLAASAPIVGAALLGLDALGAAPAAAARVRAELGEAFARLEGDGARVAAGGPRAPAADGDGLLRSARG
ncbi:MAG TPA: BadF/BadG/BcrA/BcrD ATPase family protein [Solirubrobacteraceae bacterium]|nr:BadF/BadG/BcrA/BcrD ATPase family protein [Solirubrobacteraceae bacterium]